jgi:cysteine desulfurase
MSVYLDWAATEPMWPEVADVYVETLQVVGNPSSLHRHGQHARTLIDESREKIARVIGADPMEIIFTSGATESINTWLKGRAFAHRHTASMPVLVVPETEHHATLDAVSWLEKAHFARVAWVGVDGDGVVDLDQVADLLSRDEDADIAGITTLAANNEVGSIQPVDEIVALATSHGVPVHIDAVGAFGHINVPWAGRGVDAMSISSHKVGGPVGVGALVVSRDAAQFEPLVHGGTQQTHRSGTMDVAGAVAFARAVELQLGTMEEENTRLRQLRDHLRDELVASGVDLEVRGSLDNRLPHNLHITVNGCDGDILLYLLDERGISVSTGSACQAGVPEPSHVLLAMGVGESGAKGALRFTLGRDTTRHEIDRVVDVFPEVATRARSAG